jgi:hydrogenase nickel incorporation protein HypA/HybF
VHEFSLAQGLVSQLLQLAEQHNAAAIITVRVHIGTMSGIVTDSFSFGFEVLAREDKLLDKAVLEITEIEPTWTCTDCGLAFSSATVPGGCATCGSPRLSQTGGDELILTQVEME